MTDLKAATEAMGFVPGVGVKRARVFAFVEKVNDNGTVDLCNCVHEVKVVVIPSDYTKKVDPSFLEVL